MCLKDKNLINENLTEKHLRDSSDYCWDHLYSIKNFFKLYAVIVKTFY